MTVHNHQSDRLRTSPVNARTHYARARVQHLAPRSSLASPQFRAAAPHSSLSRRSSAAFQQSNTAARSRSNLDARTIRPNLPPRARGHRRIIRRQSPTSTGRATRCGGCGPDVESASSDISRRRVSNSRRQTAQVFTCSSITAFCEPSSASSEYSARSSANCSCAAIVSANRNRSPQTQQPRPDPGLNLPAARRLLRQFPYASSLRKPHLQSRPLAPAWNSSLRESSPRSPRSALSREIRFPRKEQRPRYRSPASA